MRFFNLSEDDEVNIIMIIGPAFLTLGITMFLFFNMPGSTHSSTVSYPEPAAMQNSIMVNHFSFLPETLPVARGGTVVWTNKDTIGHTITASDGSFDTGILSKDESGSIIFDTPGIYKYHCSVHPFMQGTITVQ